MKDKDSTVFLIELFLVFLNVHDRECVYFRSLPAPLQLEIDVHSFAFLYF